MQSQIGNCVKQKEVGFSQESLSEITPVTCPNPNLKSPWITRERGQEEALVA